MRWWHSEEAETLQCLPSRWHSRRDAVAVARTRACSSSLIPTFAKARAPSGHPWVPISPFPLVCWDQRARTGPSCVTRPAPRGNEHADGPAAEGAGWESHTSHVGAACQRRSAPRVRGSSNYPCTGPPAPQQREIPAQCEHCCSLSRYLGTPLLWLAAQETAALMGPQRVMPPGPWAPAGNASLGCSTFL